MDVPQYVRAKLTLEVSHSVAPGRASCAIRKQDITGIGKMSFFVMALAGQTHQLKPGIKDWGLS